MCFFSCVFFTTGTLAFEHEAFVVVSLHLRPLVCMWEPSDSWLGLIWGVRCRQKAAEEPRRSEHLVSSQRGRRVFIGPSWNSILLKTRNGHRALGRRKKGARDQRLSFIPEWPKYSPPSEAHFSQLCSLQLFWHPCRILMAILFSSDLHLQLKLRWHEKLIFMLTLACLAIKYLSIFIKKYQYILLLKVW